jgi:hypothetical protein
MSKFYIINELENNRLWLVNLDKRIVECLDKEVIGSMSAAGMEFLDAIDTCEEVALINTARGEPSDRAYAFDCRSDVSDRAYTFDARSKRLDQSLDVSSTMVN